MPDKPILEGDLSRVQLPDVLSFVGMIRGDGKLTVRLRDLDLGLVQVQLLEVRRFAGHLRHDQLRRRDFLPDPRHLVEPPDPLHDHAGGIAASGGSAGGHLAASTALLESLDEKNENLQISSIPNALVLFNPVLDMPEIVELKSVPEDQSRDWSKKAIEISPIHHIKKNVPPTIIFHGTADSTVPFGQVIRFCEAMKKERNRCEVVPFEGRPHAFFNYRKGENPDYFVTLRKADEFLISIGYLKGEASIK